MQENRSYRIRTKVGAEAPDVINVRLDQTYDMLEILSLKLSQTNAYRLFESNYGVIAGRVLANGGFGIPNAKVSVFVEVDDEDKSDTAKKSLYPFSSIQSKDSKRRRYNLLPDESVNACHQAVGTFPNKRLVLDNDNVVEVFDKYWKHTTCTNESGDFMLVGIPTGTQQVHVDIDLSDVGILSQRPRDMVGKGYNINLFESPNKFRQGNDLDSLAQIVSQNKSIHVYPFWGDSTDADEDESLIAVTRCDIDVNYKFEPTCVFIGSVVTDKGSNAISCNCTAMDDCGKMADLIPSEGSIEMIRKTPSGSTEEWPIQGNRLIDGDGVWCYQIPMNLDYVTTDEYGRLVQTDDPDRGIPTRTRVRFRFSLDENPDDAQATKRSKMLVPNNPRISADYPDFTQSGEVDYEFGTNTLDESYVDLFWNNVYTVKSYIPRIQKNSKPTNKKYTGIKLINHAGDNLQFPYNNLYIKLAFSHRLICVLTKFIIYLVMFINSIISLIGEPFCLLRKILDKIACVIKIFGLCPLRPIVLPFIKLCEALILPCIKLSSEFCDDGINRVTYYPGCGIFGESSCVWEMQKTRHVKNEQSKPADEQSEADNTPNFANDLDGSESRLFTCVENSLAQSNEATSFGFSNDWINGCIYFPLWHRKITAKKSFLFGLFSVPQKDLWCSTNHHPNDLFLHRSCALNLASTKSFKDNSPNHDNIAMPVYNTLASDSDCGTKCHHEAHRIQVYKGVVATTQNMLGQTVYYYTPVHVNSGLQTNSYIHSEKVPDKPRYGEVLLLWATDIVLLGSLNDCSQQGIPQFFKRLSASTYRLPTDILHTDSDILNSFDEDGKPVIEVSADTIASGCDWGNHNPYDACAKKKNGTGGEYDGGLFYGIGCSSIEMVRKSCINLTRACEYGVDLDKTASILINRERLLTGSDDAYKTLVSDGFISYDELDDVNGRSMFATLNYNNLRTKRNSATGLREYEFKHLYPDNFDGQMYNLMNTAQRSCGSDITYQNNYQLELPSIDYYRFRMGADPYYYSQLEDGSFTTTQRFPRYENSFYFYFGLKAGKSAIEKFNSQFFAPCDSVPQEPFALIVRTYPTSFCKDDGGDTCARIEINLTGVAAPYVLSVTYTDSGESSITYTASNLSDAKISLGDPNQGQKNYTNLTDPELKDGLKYVDESGTTQRMTESMVQNGLYIITVTNSEGDVVSKDVEVAGPKLTYKYETDNFSLRHADLVELAGSTFADIADYGLDVDYTKQRIDIGGSVVITHLFSEMDLSYVKVSVKALRSLDESTTPFEDWSKEVIAQVRATSDVSTLHEFVKIIDGKTWKPSDSLRLPLPAPNVEYELRVEQICKQGGAYTESRGNSATVKFTLNNPGPYRLYINDVDYEVVKGFKSGWTVQKSTPSDPRFRWDGIVTGWNAVTKNGGMQELTEDELAAWDKYNTLVSALLATQIMRTGLEWPTDMCLDAASTPTFSQVKEVATKRLAVVEGLSRLSNDATEEDKAAMVEKLQNRWVTGTDMTWPDAFCIAADAKAADLTIDSINSVIDKRLSIVKGVSVIDEDTWRIKEGVDQTLTSLQDTRIKGTSLTWPDDLRIPSYGTGLTTSALRRIYLNSITAKRVAAVADVKALYPVTTVTLAAMTSVLQERKIADTSQTWPDGMYIAAADASSLTEEYVGTVADNRLGAIEGICLLDPSSDDITEEAVFNQLRADAASWWPSAMCVTCKKEALLSTAIAYVNQVLRRRRTIIDGLSNLTQTHLDDKMSIDSVITSLRNPRMRGTASEWPSALVADIATRGVSTEMIATLNNVGKYRLSSVEDVANLYPVTVANAQQMGAILKEKRIFAWRTRCNGNSGSKWPASMRATSKTAKDEETLRAIAAERMAAVDYWSNSYWGTSVTPIKLLGEQNMRVGRGATATNLITNDEIQRWPSGMYLQSTDDVTVADLINVSSRRFSILYYTPDLTDSSTATEGALTKHFLCNQKIMVSLFDANNPEVLYKWPDELCFDATRATDLDDTELKQKIVNTARSRMSIVEGIYTLSSRAKNSEIESLARLLSRATTPYQLYGEDDASTDEPVELKDTDGSAIVMRWPQDLRVAIGNSGQPILPTTKADQIAYLNSIVNRRLSIVEEYESAMGVLNRLSPTRDSILATQLTWILAHDAMMVWGATCPMWPMEEMCIDSIDTSMSNADINAVIDRRRTVLNETYNFEALTYGHTIGNKYGWLWPEDLYLSESSTISQMYDVIYKRLSAVERVANLVGELSHSPAARTALAEALENDNVIAQTGLEWPDHMCIAADVDVSALSVEEIASIAMARLAVAEGIESVNANSDQARIANLKSLLTQSEISGTLIPWPDSYCLTPTIDDMNVIARGRLSVVDGLRTFSQSEWSLKNSVDTTIARLRSCPMWEDAALYWPDDLSLFDIYEVNRVIDNRLNVAAGIEALPDDASDSDKATMISRLSNADIVGTGLMWPEDMYIAEDTDPSSLSVDEINDVIDKRLGVVGSLTEITADDWVDDWSMVEVLGDLQPISLWQGGFQWPAEFYLDTSTWTLNAVNHLVDARKSLVDGIAQLTPMQASDKILDWPDQLFIPDSVDASTLSDDDIINMIGYRESVVSGIQLLQDDAAPEEKSALVALLKRVHVVDETCTWPMALRVLRAHTALDDVLVNALIARLQVVQDVAEFGPVNELNKDAMIDILKTTTVTVPVGSAIATLTWPDDMCIAVDADPSQVGLSDVNAIAERRLATVEVLDELSAGIVKLFNLLRVAEIADTGSTWPDNMCIPATSETSLTVGAMYAVADERLSAVEGLSELCDGMGDVAASLKDTEMIDTGLTWPDDMCIAAGDNFSSLTVGYVTAVIDNRLAVVEGLRILRFGEGVTAKKAMVDLLKDTSIKGTSLTWPEDMCIAADTDANSMTVDAINAVTNKRLAVVEGLESWSTTMTNAVTALQDGNIAGTTSTWPTSMCIAADADIPSLTINRVTNAANARLSTVATIKGLVADRSDEDEIAILTLLQVAGLRCAGIKWPADMYFSTRIKASDLTVDEINSVVEKRLSMIEGLTRDNLDYSRILLKQPTVYTFTAMATRTAMARRLQTADMLYSTFVSWPSALRMDYILGQITARDADIINAIAQGRLSAVQAVREQYQAATIDYTKLADALRVNTITEGSTTSWPEELQYDGSDTDASAMKVVAEKRLATVALIYDYVNTLPGEKATTAMQVRTLAILLNQSDIYTSRAKYVWPTDMYIDDEFVDVTDASAITTMNTVAANRLAIIDGIESIDQDDWQCKSDIDTAIVNLYTPNVSAVVNGKEMESMDGMQWAASMCLDPAANLSLGIINDTIDARMAVVDGVEVLPESEWEDADRVNALKAILQTAAIEALGSEWPDELVLDDDSVTTFSSVEEKVNNRLSVVSDVKLLPSPCTVEQLRIVASDLKNDDSISGNGWPDGPHWPSHMHIADNVDTDTLGEDDYATVSEVADRRLSVVSDLCDAHTLAQTLANTAMLGIDRTWPADMCISSEGLYTLADMVSIAKKRLTVVENVQVLLESDEPTNPLVATLQDPAMQGTEVAWPPSMCVTITNPSLTQLNQAAAARLSTATGLVDIDAMIEALRTPAIAGEAAYAAYTWPDDYCIAADADVATLTLSDINAAANKRLSAVEDVAECYGTNGVTDENKAEMTDLLKRTKIQGTALTWPSDKCLAEDVVMSTLTVDQVDTVANARLSIVDGVAMLPTNATADAKSNMAILLQDVQIAGTDLTWPADMCIAADINVNSLSVSSINNIAKLRLDVVQRERGLIEDSLTIDNIATLLMNQDIRTSMGQDMCWPEALCLDSTDLAEDVTRLNSVATMRLSTVQSIRVLPDSASTGQIQKQLACLQKSDITYKSGSATISTGLTWPAEMCMNWSVDQYNEMITRRLKAVDDVMAAYEEAGPDLINALKNPQIAGTSLTWPEDMCIAADVDTDKLTVEQIRYIAQTRLLAVDGLSRITDMDTAQATINLLLHPTITIGTGYSAINTDAVWPDSMHLLPWINKAAEKRLSVVTGVSTLDTQSATYRQKLKLAAILRDNRMTCSTGIQWPAAMCIASDADVFNLSIDQINDVIAKRLAVVEGLALLPANATADAKSSMVDLLRDTSIKGTDLTWPEDMCIAADANVNSLTVDAINAVVNNRLAVVEGINLLDDDTPNDYIADMAIQLQQTIMTGTEATWPPNMRISSNSNPSLARVKQVAAKRLSAVDGLADTDSLIDFLRHSAIEEGTVYTWPEGMYINQYETPTIELLRDVSKSRLAVVSDVAALYGTSGATIENKAAMTDLLKESKIAGTGRTWPGGYFLDSATDISNLTVAEVNDVAENRLSIVENLYKPTSTQWGHWEAADEVLGLLRDQDIKYMDGATWIDTGIDWPSAMCLDADTTPTSNSEVNAIVARRRATVPSIDEITSADGGALTNIDELIRLLRDSTIAGAGELIEWPATYYSIHEDCYRLRTSTPTQKELSAVVQNRLDVVQRRHGTYAIHYPIEAGEWSDDEFREWLIAQLSDRKMWEVDGSNDPTWPSEMSIVSVGAVESVKNARLAVVEGLELLSDDTIPPEIIDLLQEPTIKGTKLTWPEDMYIANDADLSSLTASEVNATISKRLSTVEGIDATYVQLAYADDASATAAWMQLVNRLQARDIMCQGVDTGLDWPDGMYLSITLAEANSVATSRLSLVEGLSDFTAKEMRAKETVDDMIEKLGQHTLSDSPYYWPDYLCLDSDDITTETINACATARLDMIRKVKDAFFLRSPSDDKTLILTVKTDNRPVYGKFVCKQEKETETENGYVHVPLDPYVDIDTMSVGGIFVPSLTHTSSEEFYEGQSQRVTSPAAWSNVTPAQKNGVMRGPFAVAVVNSNRLTIPSAVKNNSNTHVKDGKLNSEKCQLSAFYTFPIIDKILKFNYLSWAMLDHPYYIPDSTTSVSPSDPRRGSYVVAPGFICGIIHNGIATNVEEPNGETTLEMMNIGYEPISIMTYLGGRTAEVNEDALPTRRVVYTNRDDLTFSYGKYIASDGEMGIGSDKSNKPYSDMSCQYQYALLPTQTAALEIGDSSYMLNDMIYGAMAVAPTSASVHDNKTRKLVVSATNAGEDVTYYVFRIGNKNVQYPINKFDSNPEPSTSRNNLYEDMIYGNKWKNGYRYGSVEYFVNKLVDTKVKEDGGDTKGYNTTGTFDKGIKKNKLYFVVAVTGTNSRAISPVFDFTEVKGKYKFESLGDLYWIDLYFEEKNLLYYIKYYKFFSSAELTLKVGDVSASGTFEPSTISYYEAWSQSISEEVGTGAALSAKLKDAYIRYGDPDGLYVHQHVEVTEDEEEPPAEGGDGSDDEEEVEEPKVLVYDCYSYMPGFTNRTSGATTANPSAWEYQTQGIKFIYIDEYGDYEYCYVDKQSDSAYITAEDISTFDTVGDYRASSYSEYTKNKLAVYLQDEDSGAKTKVAFDTRQNFHLQDTLYYNPTLPHYRRPLVLSMSKDQWKAAKGASMKKALKWYVTDASGLKHLVKTSKA